MADKDQAKAEVLNISRKFGFVGDDIMAQIEAWNPDIRRIIEEGMLAKDRLAAHSIKTYDPQRLDLYHLWLIHRY